MGFNLSTIILLIGIFLGCAYAAKLKPRMVDGHDVPAGKYRFHAYVSDASGFLCGATILSKRYLLTDGVCVSGVDPRNMIVTVGTDLFNDTNAPTYKVESTVVHENFQVVRGLFWNYPINDIAVIRVKQNIVFDDKVETVKLPTKNYRVPDNSSTTFLGWGSAKALGEYPKVQQYAKFKILNKDECKSIWLNNKLIQLENNTICTQATGTQAVCYGDLGSPLLTEDGIQIGIASFGSKCSGVFPDVFTDVSAYVDWINEFLE